MSSDRSQRIVYPIDSRPPPRRALLLGLQHVLTMFGATVSVPLLFAAPLHASPGELAVLVSSVMLCSGLATFFQVRWGSRLPIIQGVSFSFLAAFFACISYAAQHPEPGVAAAALSMRYIAGSILVGSVVEALVGFSGLMGRLRRLVSPVVIGPVIMLIGLALFQHGAPKAGTYWPIGGLTIFLIAFFSLILARSYRLFRTLPVLLAVATSWAVCALASAAGVFTEGHPAYVDLAGVVAAPWVRLELFWGDHSILLPWGLPRFQAGLILATLAGYLASMIESFGDYHGCAAMAGIQPPTETQISRGIGCFLSGLLGGFASTSYSENIALIGVTRVASRFVVLVAAGLLLLLGVMAKFGAVVATLPGPVVGGLYCSLFGLIAAIGIQQLARADLTSQRNLFIAGFSLFMGLSLPAYFQGTLYGNGTEAVQAALPPWLASMVVAVGSTGMGVAAVLGIVLDNLVPGTDRERGLAE
jgi:nucleobase transporter 1/2